MFSSGNVPRYSAEEVLCGRLDQIISLKVSTHAGAHHFCQIARMPGLGQKYGPGLVVGYGQGHEASFLKQCLRVTIIGVDLYPPACDFCDQDFAPVLANALNLPFREETFEFVFCHHVIEHVADPRTILIEIKRVLRPGGWLYIGTPNRHRIVGYIGSYKVTFRQKILWNLRDYADRLRGQFTNEMGAHAGFSQQELEDLLRKSGFSTIHWLTKEYLWFKYGHRWPRWVLRVVTSPAVIQFAAPSLYVLCEK